MYMERIYHRFSIIRYLVRTMNHIIPIILVFFLLIPGCVQAFSGEKDQFAKDSLPESGFSVFTPQSWRVDTILEKAQMVFSSPDNQASIAVEIQELYNPEGAELLNLEQGKPNRTQIGYRETIQISGKDGFQWEFLVNENDRQYIEGVIWITRECQDRGNRKISYIIRFEYPAGDARREEMVREILDSIELDCPSANKYTNTGVEIHIPQSWHMEKTIEKSHVVFTHPVNQAFIDVYIDQKTLPEGQGPGGIGISYETPNATARESFKEIQISGVEGLIWEFLVNGSNRQYIEGFIGIARECPGLHYNEIIYFIHYQYNLGDDHLERTVKAMLDSIELTCPPVFDAFNNRLTVNTPQSWRVNRLLEKPRAIVPFSDGELSIRISIEPYYHPEGMEERNAIFTHGVPNSTPIEYKKTIQIAGGEGIQRTFLVSDPDREYMNGFISFTRKCEGHLYNRIFYFINYQYTKGDARSEEKVNAFLKSIEVNCPSDHLFPQSPVDDSQGA